MELKEYFVALNMVENLGVFEIKKLLDKFRRPDEIFKASVFNLRKVSSIKKDTAFAIKKILSSKRFKNELKAIQRNKIKVLTLFDENYPQNLKNIYDPPIVLYVKGKLVKKDAISISVVGSRRASNYGLRVAYTLSKDLVLSNITVVSGMAEGINTASCEGAIEAEGRTISVLGCGLNFIYSSNNKGLADSISDSGALISEFPLDTAPTKENFSRRNRIISGLSLGTVVVEAARGSDSLNIASFALDQGREVFAVPHGPGTFNSKGANRLIKDGSKLIEGVNDIIDELRPELREYIRFNKKEQKVVSDIEDEEKDLYEILSKKPHNFNKLNLKSSMDKENLLSSLLSLQIKGLVEKLPGNLFIKSDLGDRIE